MSSKIPTKEYLQRMSKVGEEYVKMARESKLLEEYNDFKKAATSSLIEAANTVHLTGYTTKTVLQSNRYCNIYQQFTDKFNQEKITNVELRYTSQKPSCNVYFAW